MFHWHYAALSSWKLCFVTSMLLKKFSSRHDKLLPYIQIRVVRMQVIKMVFKISLFSVGLLQMICLFIHFIFSQWGFGQNGKQKCLERRKKMLISLHHDISVCFSFFRRHLRSWESASVTGGSLCSNRSLKSSLSRFALAARVCRRMRDENSVEQLYKLLLTDLTFGN